MYSSMHVNPFTSMNNQQKRIKPTEPVEYYENGLFVQQKNTEARHSCIECSKIPKQSWRCSKCAAGGRNIYCGNCLGKCKFCGSKEFVKTTAALRGLMVNCPKGCGQRMILRQLDEHLENECPRRPRRCRYHEIGCQYEGEGDDIIQHEGSADAHLAVLVAAILEMKGWIEQLLRQQNNK